MTGRKNQSRARRELMRSLGTSGRKLLWAVARFHDLDLINASLLEPHLAARIERSRKLGTETFPYPRVVAVRVDRYWDNAAQMSGEQRWSHLSRIVEIIRSETADIISRWFSRRDGEFLCLATPRTDLEKLGAAFNRIRDRLETDDALAIPVTISVASASAIEFEDPNVDAAIVSQRTSDYAVRRMLMVSQSGGNSVNLGGSKRTRGAWLVALLDHDDLHADMVANLLRLDDVEVHHVRSGENALEEIARTQPDLILADLDLPAVSPFEIRESLQRSWTTSSIPFVLFTHHRDDRVLADAFRSGIIHVIGKPYPVEELRGLVRLLLQRVSDVG